MGSPKILSLRQRDETLATGGQDGRLVTIGSITYDLDSITQNKTVDDWRSSASLQNAA